MLANWITLSRFPLLLASVVILYAESPHVQLAGAAVLFLGLMLDTVDGLVARATGQSSLLGSVLDIAADRTYELVLWVCFANLGLVSAAIPPIILVRTTLTDALRSIGTAAGTAPFAQPGSRLGRFLVGSAWMRVAYSVSKVVTFVGLAVAHALSGFAPEAGLADAAGRMKSALGITAWGAVLLCVVRGLPVIAGSLRRYRGQLTPPSRLSRRGPPSAARRHAAG